ncbi:hypothetical protein BJY01DRAFT_211028 [Aspergillus pseudoustus]|uniref:DUF3752 domain-containing protein n=1 Tax=Aspergillus pseudoustus TaxID=1810923 RepID=A0ABR4KA18_9EURO
MDNPSKRKHNVAAGPSPQPSVTSLGREKRRKVIGPSLPPPIEPSKQSDNSEVNSDSDSSSDDEFGPNLPPPAGSTPASLPTPQTSINPSAEKQAEKSAPQRDAWMLAPPTGDSRSSRADPTKLRNRKFQSGPRVGGAASGGGGVDSSWTETPEEKMRRLQNEAMGIVSSAASGKGGGGAGAMSEAEERKAQAMREKVQIYNERVRKEDASVIEERKRKEKEEEDDPSKRAFDKEKDMALGGRISHAQRREMMNKAADFGSRFSKGKFL